MGSYVSGGPWYMLFVPGTPATAYKEGWYFDVWSGIGYCGDNQTCPVSGSCTAGPGFDNTIDTAGADNGFGLQWARTVGPGGSTTVSDWWTFGTVPTIPGQEPPTATPTATSTQTRTPTPTATATPTPSRTFTPTATPTGTVEVCNETITARLARPRRRIPGNDSPFR